MSSKTFVKRLEAPSKDLKYYVNKSKGGYSNAIIIDSTTGYTLPNCVGYAYGRFMEECGLTSCKLSAGNAEDWWAYSDGYTRGQTPKLGAVAVWKKGKVKTSSDGCGHVAVVEETDGSTYALCSQSAYGGTTFSTVTIKKSEGWKYGSGFDFLGFIYPPVEFTTKISTAATSVTTGAKYTLNNTPVYGDYSGSTIGTRNGDYYAWDNYVKNNRVKMTNDPKRAGVSGQVSFFADIATITPSTSTAATKAELTATSYPDLSSGKYYRVRKTFADEKTAKGSYSTWSNAYRAWVNNKSAGYHVYNNDGKQLD